MVKSALKNTSEFLMRSQNTIMSAAFILASAAGANAVLGLVKSRVLTSFFGISDDLSIFYTADRIPNLIYSVLVVGALSTIFIPIFASLYKKDVKKAWQTASSIINVSLMFFVVVGGAIFIFAPQIMRLLSVGKFTEAQLVLGANLMRVMLAAQLILVLSSFVTSVLQSFKYFFIPALAPIIYNIGMIVGVATLSTKFGIYGPAYGVVIGALLHLLIQVPLLRKVHFSFMFSLNLKDQGIRDMFRLVPPRIVSVLIGNILYTINNSLAIIISTPSVVFLKYANQLQFFPVNLFGLSIASAMLPTLSGETDTQDRDKFKKTFLTSLHQMLFMVVPASVGLLVLRVPVVRIVYGVSKFPWDATIQTAQTLAFFSISIFAQSSIYLITRAFYALKDTLTPVKVSLVTIFVNIFLSIFFIKGLGLEVWAVALSFSITSLIDMFVLLFLLAKKLDGFETRALFGPLIKICFSAVFMGISLYIPLKALDSVVFDTSRTAGLIVLTAVACVAGIASYLFFTWIFKVKEIEMLYRLIGKLQLKKSEVAAVAEEKTEI